VTEPTLCVEFHFNNTGPFIIRPVISTVVFIQHQQNASRGHKCKENRGHKVIYSQSRQMVLGFTV
jgi:hypothetical protein